MIEFSQDKDELVVTATILDSDGNVAPTDSKSWESSNPQLVALGNVSADGLTATFVHASPNALGTCQIKLTTDVDLGAGVQTINHTEEVTVVAGKGASISFSVAP